jgi:pimeloyl-ACP methyl ester carboxylesterase
VMLFDWPGHGESEGRVRLGRDETASLHALVDFVAAQPGVSGDRIGALGTSVGSALVAKGAAEDPRLRALALVGAFTDSDAQTRYEYRYPWAYWPAIWASHRKMESAPLRPIDAMPSLGGPSRAVLLVAGAKDEVVPPAMAEALYGAAPGPDKELWLVPNAGHMDIDEKSGGAYAKRIVVFFDRALRKVSG